jgi:hypothetical protein
MPEPGPRKGRETKQAEADPLSANFMSDSLLRGAVQSSWSPSLGLRSEYTLNRFVEECGDVEGER